MNNGIFLKNLALLILLVCGKLSSLHCQTDIPIEAYNQMRDQLNEEIKDLRLTESVFRDSISSLNIRITYIEKNVLDLGDEKAKLEVDRNRIIERSNLQKDKITELNNSILSLKDRKNNLTAANDKLKLEITKLNDDNAKLKQQITKLDGLYEKIANLNAENRNIQQSFDQLKADYFGIEEANRKLKDYVHRLQNQLAHYEIFEEQEIKSIGERVQIIVNLPVVDPYNEELLEINENLNLFLVSFPESDSLRKYKVKLSEHMNNLIKFTNASVVLERDFDEEGIQNALIDLNSISNPSKGFISLIRKKSDLVTSYCFVYNQIRSGIINIDLTPPRIIKQKEIDRLLDKSSDYPFLQKVLREKEKNIMEQGNPLIKEIECN